MKIEEMSLPEIATIRIYIQRMYSGLFFMGKCIDEVRAKKYEDIIKKCDTIFDKNIDTLL